MRRHTAKHPSGPVAKVTPMPVARASSRNSGMVVVLAAGHKVAMVLVLVVVVVGVESDLRLGAVTKQFQKGDRKSTRLNSSHVKISYAVFCLKKKQQRV